MYQILRKTHKNSVVSAIHLITDYRLLITAGLFLTGCMGVYEGGFECPPGIGVGCKSISEVNDMVNKGEIPKPYPIGSHQSGCATCSSASLDSNFSLTGQTIHEEPQIWYAPEAFLEAPLVETQLIEASFVGYPLMDGPLLGEPLIEKP